MSAIRKRKKKMQIASKKNRTKKKERQLGLGDIKTISQGNIALENLKALAGKTTDIESCAL